MPPRLTASEKVRESQDRLLSDIRARDAAVEEMRAARDRVSSDLAASEAEVERLQQLAAARAVRDRERLEAFEVAVEALGERPRLAQMLRGMWGGL